MRNHELTKAAGVGDVASVQELIAGGAGVDARDDQGRTALLVATHANQVQPRRC